MSLVVVDELAPVLVTVRSEISEVKKLLLQFEGEVAQLNGLNPLEKNAKKAAQGFDLAVQILHEVEKILAILSQNISNESMLKRPLHITDVRLERIRGKLMQIQKASSDRDVIETGKKVELF